MSDQPSKPSSSQRAQSPSQPGAPNRPQIRNYGNDMGGYFVARRHYQQEARNPNTSDEQRARAATNVSTINMMNAQFWSSNRHRAIRSTPEQRNPDIRQGGGGRAGSSAAGQGDAGGGAQKQEFGGTYGGPYGGNYGKK